MVRVPLNVLQAENEKSETERNCNIEVKPQHKECVGSTGFRSVCGLVSSAELGS